MGNKHNSKRDRKHSNKRRRHTGGRNRNHRGAPPRRPSAPRHSGGQAPEPNRRPTKERSRNFGVFRAPNADPDSASVVWMNLEFNPEKFAGFEAEDGSLCLPILDEDRNDAAFPVIDVHGTGGLSELLLVAGDGEVSDADDELLVEFFRGRVELNDPCFEHLTADQLAPVPQTGYPGVGEREVQHWTYQACEPAADGTRMFLATGKYGEQTFLVINPDGDACDACYLAAVEDNAQRAFWRRRRKAGDPYALLNADLMRFLGGRS
jgi:hypothetical protein